jgi:lysophospholipid acyltransferase (LPLAT)-like uncharacterized protein
MRIETPLPRAPVVWIAWHEANLITVASHERTRRGAAIAFVPPGLTGIIMRGWLEELGATPVLLAPGARRGLGLRQMEAALSAGKDVLIAVDGPRGPRHHVAPGAIWLAHATGAEMRPVGCAASPSLRLPRWDKLIVPLPGARTVIVMGAAWSFAGIERGLGQASEHLSSVLHDLTLTARAAVQAVHGLKPEEASPWP